ncbi:MAG: hypothetical protein GY835_23515 [bacterium]|nr:hypothetical protein [bacterium]
MNNNARRYWLFVGLIFLTISCRKGCEFESPLLIGWHQVDIGWATLRLPAKYPSIPEEKQARHASFLVFEYGEFRVTEYGGSYLFTIPEDDDSKLDYEICEIRTTEYSVTVVSYLNENRRKGRYVTWAAWFPEPQTPGVFRPLGYLTIESPISEGQEEALNIVSSLRLKYTIGGRE